MTAQDSVRESLCSMSVRAREIFLFTSSFGPNRENPVQFRSQTGRAKIKAESTGQGYKYGQAVSLGFPASHVQFGAPIFQFQQ